MGASADVLSSSSGARSVHFTGGGEKGERGREREKTNMKVWMSDVAYLPDMETWPPV